LGQDGSSWESGSGGAGGLGCSLPRDGSAGASFWVNTGGDSVACGNTGGGALGQDEVVIYIPGGLRLTRG